jgi:hypothetical protein
MGDRAHRIGAIVVFAAGASALRVRMAAFALPLAGGLAAGGGGHHGTTGQTRRPGPSPRLVEVHHESTLCLDWPPRAPLPGG